MNPTDLDREGVIQSAVNARKITAESAPQYRAMYQSNPQATRHLLTAPVEQGGLMAGLHGPVGSPAGPSAAEYPAEWLPEVAHQTTAAPVAGQAPVAAQAPAGDGSYPHEWLPNIRRQPSASPVLVAGD